MLERKARDTISNPALREHVDAYDEVSCAYARVRARANKRGAYPVDSWTRRVIKYSSMDFKWSDSRSLNVIEPGRQLTA